MKDAAQGGHYWSIDTGRVTIYAQGMDIRHHLPLSPRDYLVLLALAEGPRHGYGILGAVTEQAGDMVTLDPANLYRSLKRLRRDGILDEADVPPDEDTPTEQRRYFELTEVGRAVVAAEARRLARLTAVAREANLLDDGVVAG